MMWGERNTRVVTFKKYIKLGSFSPLALLFRVVHTVVWHSAVLGAHNMTVIFK